MFQPKRKDAFALELLRFRVITLNGWGWHAGCWIQQFGFPTGKKPFCRASSS